MFQRLFRRYGYVLIGIVLGLSIFVLFRSCSLDMLSEKRYVIEQENNWQKLHAMGKERNISAFNADLLAAIARESGFRVQVTVSTDPLQELKLKKTQGVLSTMQPNYLNKDTLLFSEPYFRSGPVLITSIADPMEGWNEKRRRIIGISQNSPSLLSLEEDPSIQLKTYQDILPALVDLREGKIDGAIFSAMPAYTYTQTFYKNELKIVTLPLTDEESIRLVALNDASGAELIEQFNAGLHALKEDGTYHNILKRWGLIDIEKIPG